MSSKTHDFILLPWNINWSSKNSCFFLPITFCALRIFCQKIITLWYDNDWDWGGLLILVLVHDQTIIPVCSLPIPKREFQFGHFWILVFGLFFFVASYYDEFIYNRHLELQTEVSRSTYNIDYFITIVPTFQLYISQNLCLYCVLRTKYGEKQSSTLLIL